jgi:hypothetical protein
MRPARLRVLVSLAVGVLVVAGCGGSDEPGGSTAPAPEPAASTTAVAEEPETGPTDRPDHTGHPTGKPAQPLPLRPGEDRLTLTMPETYTPAPPTGVGTDDYRCFLLDPGLARDSYLTGTNVVPGNPDVVHHVILFRVTPDQVAAAERLDADHDGPGWTCFGGSGLPGDLSNVDDASWLGAWAPGGKETMTSTGYGVDLPRGSRIVMQVHYNLLAGRSPDMSSTQIRVTPRRDDITPLHTYLLPAPVELPCRPGHDGGPLCDRDAAVADLKARVGQGPGSAADLLHLLCRSRPTPTDTSSCTRTVGRPMTILGVAGHMHLLGRQIRIELNPETPDAETVLDIRVWDFDNQGARPIDPVEVEPGENVKVTCKHVQWLRDLLPAFEGQEEKYVVWGEGTTDEMCLGMLSVAYR